MQSRSTTRSAAVRPVGMLRARFLLTAAVLLATMFQAEAQEPGGAQLAAKAEGGRSAVAAELPTDLDLTFDARAFVAETDGVGETAWPMAGEGATTAVEAKNSRVQFDGIHRMKIDLYPDDLRPAGDR